ncbi:MAG: cytochrome-c peroxidase [Bacteroidota bacterium]
MKYMINVSGKKHSTFASVVFVFFALALIFAHCSQSDTDTKRQSRELTELQNRTLTFISPLPANAFAEEMIPPEEIIELGKMLYYEPRISKSGLISCNTCHNMATFGVDQLPVSIGHGWQKGLINAPSVLNAAFHETQFWDGSAADVEEQAGMPILDKLEMAATEEHVIAGLSSMPDYVERFRKAFPGQENPLVYDNVGLALGAFERTLVTKSPFDHFLQGDDGALTNQQKEGLELFLNTGCQACHRGVVMGGDMFAFFNTPKEKETGKAHPGRFDFTGREADKHFFKVPSLLNVAQTYPYLHDGSVWKIEEAIHIVAKDMLNKELSSEEIGLLAAFLESLTGEIPEYALKLPVLPPSTKYTPRPRFDI